MSTEFQPRKAQKHSVKLKMAIQGPSGSGKTEGALALAKNFVPNAKVLVIDTENDSASLYADRYEFDTISLHAPYTSARYQQAMHAAVAGGYDVLIVDSISQQWDGEGGILRRKEEKDRSGGNSFTNWASFTPEHTKFMEFIKQLPIHTIVTMRSKQAYVLEKNDRGKETPRKVGLDPIQREGTEYEYTIVFEVGMSHRATTSKNRTTLFQGDDPIDLTSPLVAESIKTWLANGVLLPRPASDVAGNVVDEAQRQQDAPGAVPPEQEWNYNSTTGLLICRVVDAKKTKKKNDTGHVVTIKVNGDIEGQALVFYNGEEHDAAILAAVGKVCKFEVTVTVNGFVMVDKVLEIDGQKPEESEEFKSQLLASALGLEREELREMHGTSNGNWSEVLTKLETEKVRRASNAE